MAERFKVVVVPQDGGLNGLTVEEAMRHVLDVFQLLSYGTESGEDVVWRLVEAKTNSPPFSVLAEAVSRKPGVNIDAIARAEKKTFRHSIAELKEGRPAPAWSEYEAQKLAGDIIERISRGVTTRIEEADDDLPTLTLDPADAPAARVMLQAIPEVSGHLTKEQIGSIDGVLTDVSTFYNKPMIRVTERKTGKSVRCLIPQELIDKFSDKTKFSDVWLHHRVVVRGLIRYDESGSVKEVSATSIDQKESRDVPVAEITDPQFTNGLSVSEYLERLREGQIG